MTKNLGIGDRRLLGSFEDEYTLITSDFEVRDILESVGCNEPYGLLFVKIGDGEYLEIWASFHTVPYVDKTACLVWSTHYQQVLFEISHTYHCIGELVKTQRFPKHYTTFQKRVITWIQSNLTSISIASVERMTIIAAFNARYISVDTLELYGISRDSLWLVR